jgi:hypothetical protein
MENYMVNRLSIILVISIASINAAEPPPTAAQVPKKNNVVKAPPNGTIHLSINLINRQDTQSNNSTNVEQITKVPQPPPINESQIVNKVSDLWKENLKIQKQIQEQGSQFISTNKWYLLAGGLSCVYAYLAYIVIQGNNYLGDLNLWSSWHQELPLDQLLAIPQQQLTQELIREIQRRYTDVSSIVDIVKPLGMFMVKSEQEEEQIKWYQSTYSWLSYLRLNKLIPMNQSRFNKITERLQRLAYYKNLFKSWTADYQLQLAERMTMWYRCPHEYVDLSQTAQLLQIEMRLKLVNYWLSKIESVTPKPI